MIKNLPNIFHIIFACIFNACLKLSYMPSNWKSAVVVMIPKPQKDPLKVNSYRPISLLCTMSKLFERVIMARLLEWVNSKNILSKYQAGFRKHKQTLDHIFRITQYVQAAFNRGHLVGSLFIDIEKAFDKVWHDGLLYKIHRLEIPAYLGKWITNYLDSRTFSVRINDSFSQSTPILAGVPQGSVLGPLLFNIFFNDVVDCQASPHIEQALFADDVAAWTKAFKLQHIQSRLQNQLNNMAQWTSKWRTKLSPDKTTYIIFSKKKKRVPLSMKLLYNGLTIKKENHPKFLGLTLDPQLNFNQHLNNISTRSLRRINMLKSIKGKDWGASTKLILTTFKTLIRPILDYVPFATLLMNEQRQLKLERVQRAAIRAAIYWPPHTRAENIYERVKLVPVIDRAYGLTRSYIQKSHKVGSISVEEIDKYEINHVRDNGPPWKSSNRPTILGLLDPRYLEKLSH